jgi:hypothetical protein
MMQHKTLLILLSLTCFIITACGGISFTTPKLTPTYISSPTRTIPSTDTPVSTVTPVPLITDLFPKIVNHEKPDIQADFAPFQNVGCDEPDKRENQYRCEEGSQLFDAGCNTITKLPLLGGLSPNYPIVLCTLEIDREFAFVELPPNECLYADGFMTTFCNRYVVYKGDKFQLVKSMDKFRALFSPVDTPNEALAFALANGKYMAQYDQTKRSDVIYWVLKLEDTYVDSTEDGYIVHVFFTNPYGCAMFSTDVVDVKVTHDGNLEVINQHTTYYLKETICKE